MNNQMLAEENAFFTACSFTCILDDIKNLVKVLEEYIKVYEDDNSLMRNTFLINVNPLEKLEQLIQQNSVFYSKIIKVTEEYVFQYKLYLNKPKHIKNLLAYYGFMNEFGLFGINFDKNKAFKYYKLSAELGSPYGTFRLAHSFEKGVGCNVNLNKALSFYRCSAKLGCIQGMHIYGTILLQSTKDPYNDLKDLARFYLHLGSQKANRDYPFIWYDYARYLEYKLRSNDFTVDIDQCFQAYKNGANLQCSNCQYRIAQCYEYGELNVLINISEACIWYQKAAHNGHIDAQTRIAELIFEVCTPDVTNISVAFNYVLTSATKGNCVAMKYMSIFYKKGLAIKPNKLIYQWWENILKVNMKLQKLIKIDSPYFDTLENMIIVQSSISESTQITTVATTDIVKAL